MKKWILRSLLAVVLLLVIGVVVLLLTIDGIIRSKVESTAQTSVGQETHLAGANLKILGGTLTLSDLTIANPKGYSAPQFLSMKDCTITVQPKSLMTDTIRVDSITIDGLQLTMQQNGISNNLNEILAAVQKQRTDNAAGASNAQSKQLAIHKILLTNTVVSLQVAGLPGAAPVELKVTLSPIETDDPMNPDGRMMKVADLTGKLLMEIAQQAASDPKFPAAMRDAFSNSLKSVDASLKSMQSNFKDVGKQVQDQVKGLGDLFKKKQ